MEGTNVIRNYKDTIFRLLFKEKRQLLSLYNAINETDYQNEVREYLKQYPLEKAVFMAVDECINTGILEDFLRDNKSEVIHMSIYEYDEELHEQTLLEEGRKEGRE